LNIDAKAANARANVFPLFLLLVGILKTVPLILVLPEPLCRGIY
jgi:hypothetical protein